MCVRMAPRTASIFAIGKPVPWKHRIDDARGFVRVIVVVGPGRESGHVVQVGGREQHVVVERDA